jgi:GR25 family glycosyltransferase involved in LPS biosynthesis
MTKGGIGCALSHYNVYKKIVKDKIKKCLILEDDIIINTNFINKCNEINNMINYDYDLLFIGYHKDSLHFSIKYDSNFNKNHNFK